MARDVRKFVQLDLSLQKLLVAGSEESAQVCVTDCPLLTYKATAVGSLETLRGRKQGKHEYCRPGQELHLVYTENSWSSDKVTDLDGNVLFKVRHPTFSSTDILITDPTDLPILRMCEKGVFSTTWHAFPGPESSSNPVLFTVKKSSTFQWSLSMHVFLGSNSKPQPDYKVKRAVGHRTIEVLRGEETVAKMKANLSFCCCPSGDDVTVAPGIDFAFVLSLFLIVRKLDRRSAAASGGAGAAAGGGGG